MQHSLRGQYQDLRVNIKVTLWNQQNYNEPLSRGGMSINVKLSEDLVAQARHHAQIRHRSVPKQIEYWSRIGKIAEENPDLPFSMIRDILHADQEELVGEYQFG